MWKLFAKLVDHPVTRVAASLVGLLALVCLGLFAVVIALTPKTPWMLAVGAGGFIGLLGWGLRLLVSLPLLAAHPALRWTVCGSLATGMAALLYTALAWPDARIWLPFLWPVGFAGLLLFLGTLASWQGPPAAHRRRDA